ncbi:hypothetical protein TSOC_015481, partial [Tetrabaena socialis]
SQPLAPPIVACGLGRLYNKEALLCFLLARRQSNSTATTAASTASTSSAAASSPEAALLYANQLRVAAGGLDHITSIKDLLVVQLQPAPPEAAAGAGPSSSTSSSSAAAAAAATAGGGGGGEGGGGFVCPLTLLPCERHPCSALRPCGHVVSDRALANLPKGEAAACPVCGAAASGPPLPINAGRE